MGVLYATSSTALCMIKGVYLSVNLPRSTEESEARARNFDKKVSNAKEYLSKAFQGIAAHIIISTHYKLHHPNSEIYIDRWILTIIRGLGGDLSELG